MIPSHSPLSTWYPPWHLVHDVLSHLKQFDEQAEILWTGVLSLEIMSVFLTHLRDVINYGCGSVGFHMIGLNPGDPSCLACVCVCGRLYKLPLL